MVNIVINTDWLFSLFYLEPVRKLVKDLNFTPFVFLFLTINIFANLKYQIVELNLQLAAERKTLSTTWFPDAGQDAGQVIPKYEVINEVRPYRINLCIILKYLFC